METFVNKCFSKNSLNILNYLSFTRGISKTRTNFQLNFSKNSPIKPRIFTGIQPTGYPHIGNYLGVLRHCKQLQDEETFDKVFISIADMHSITLPQKPEHLKENILNLACSLLACGFDRMDTVVFQQSCVPQHTELAWVLGCITTMNKLDHLPQWKEKSEWRKEIPFGLFAYPLLQAADILLYKTTDVPMGDDQIKHLELARYLARTFNKKFSHNFFPIPNQIAGGHPRIKSLRDPQQKMSKSEKDSRGRIELFDSPDEIMEKLKKAVTDAQGVIGYDPEGRPGVSNLIDIHSAFSHTTPDQICSNFGHLRTVEYKNLVAECIIEDLKPIRSKIVHLRNQPEHVWSVLHKGKQLAMQVAYENYLEVKKAIGFL